MSSDKPQRNASPFGKVKWPPANLTDECGEIPAAIKSNGSKTLMNIENNQKLLIAKLLDLTANVSDLTKKVDAIFNTLNGGDDEANRGLKKDMNNVYQKIAKVGSNLIKTVEEGMNDGTLEHSFASDISACLKASVAMTTGVDRDTIRAAYEDVRSDATPTDWAVFKFEGARIVCAARGSDFSEFRQAFGDDDRAFGYIRLQMGDEMSKRRKFLFVTWVGPNVSVINRAKMSTDKALMKDIISNFAVELQLESQGEIDVEQFRDALNRAGGANYGTGVRDL